MEDAWRNALINSNYNNDFLIGFAEYKIKQKNYIEAEKIIENYLNKNVSLDEKSEEEKNISIAVEMFSSRYNLIKAYFEYETKNIESAKQYTQIIKKSYDPCAQYTWAQYLSSKAAENEKNNHDFALYLFKESDIFFRYAEHSGMRGFNFYNNWGGVLSYLGQQERAIEKYRQALNYHGVKSWALLNWGVSLQKLNRHKEAEEKFKESLQNSTIVRAVEGYIYSIYNQGDYSRFLDEYDRYDIYFKSDKRIKLYVGFSYCITNNRSMAEHYLSEIKENIDVSNDERENLKECINNIKL